ncbi:hypothetical protein AB0O76_11630 [Streptomyces sp. NPDC086554]
MLWIRKNPSGDWLAGRGTLMRWDFAAGRAGLDRLAGHPVASPPPPAW